MKDWRCDSCYKDIEVFDDYEPEGCCSGYQCGCMGKVINPVFCDECEERVWGKKEVNKCKTKKKNAKHTVRNG